MFDLLDTVLDSIKSVVYRHCSSVSSELGVGIIIREYHQEQMDLTVRGRVSMNMVFESG